MKVHFIAIGGAIMHQLAICLQKKGHIVSGSDDVIYDPARTNLTKARLIPQDEGWFPKKIDKSIDAIILGMHAKPDNPELLRAQELKIPIHSFPSFFYNETKNKKRIVIAGSHGKTTITSMLTHVFQKLNQSFDVLVGAKIKGLDQMVQLANETPFAIIEGDEYLSSPIDRRPKFIHYKANLAVLNGIAWDHINVFPTFANYIEQFQFFIDSCADDATIFYNKRDPEVVNLIEQQADTSHTYIPYGLPEYTTSGLGTSVTCGNQQYPLSIFGQHNMNNLEAARSIANCMDVDTNTFYSLMKDYSGAARRLETLHSDEQQVLLKDFAHAPSKVRASLAAVREAFPNKKVIAFLELHTYSSLNPVFMKEYKDTLLPADKAFVFYDEHALRIKKLSEIANNSIHTAFNSPITVIDTPSDLEQAFLKHKDEEAVFLMMSSGSWAKTGLLEKMKSAMAK